MAYREEYGSIASEYEKNKKSKKKQTGISTALGGATGTARGQTSSTTQQLLGAPKSESLGGYAAELMGRGVSGTATGKVSRTTRDRGSGTFSMGGRFQTRAARATEKYVPPERKFRGEQVVAKNVFAKPDWRMSGHSADTTTMKFKGLVTGREQGINPADYENTMKERAFRPRGIPKSPYGRRSREVKRRAKNTGERVR